MSALRSYFSSNPPADSGTAPGRPPPPTDGAMNGEIIKFEGRNLRLTKLIAEGGFSYVYYGDFGGQIVAVKKVLTPDPSAASSLDFEIELLAQLNHRHIVKLLGTKRSPVENYIIMEYCSPLPVPIAGSHLSSTGAVEQKSGHFLLIGNVFKQCCSAVEYLHNLRIAHRDIKLENFLVGPDGFVKLIDFGSATREFIYPSIEWKAKERGIVEEEIASKTTPMYRSPEQLDLWLNYPIDSRVDMWSLGCLLYLFIYSTHPFPDSNKLAIINAKYSNAKSNPEENSKMDVFYQIIRGLLQPNPADRMSFDSIFKYLAEIPMQKLDFRQPVFPSYAEPTNYGQRDEAIRSTAGGSKNLLSSLRGGAESLFKNIKEAADAYYSGATSSRDNGTIPSVADLRGPQENPRRQPPPAEIVVPPRPPKPTTPTPSIHARIPQSVTSTTTKEEIINTQPPAKVDILLDFGDATKVVDDIKQMEAAAGQTDTKNNIDLLVDLFGGVSTSAASTSNDNISSQIQPDLFGFQETTKIQSQPPLLPHSVKINHPEVHVPAKSMSGNLLDDLDLFGTTSTNNSTASSSIPTSSSFGSLAQLKPDKIAMNKNQNVSTPNLTDLLSNDTTNTQQQPNYSRSAFEPPAPPKPTNLNDMFGEFLKSEGFNVSSNNNKTQTIGELRREEMIKSGVNPINLKVSGWKEGKTKNIRALLSSLHTITWPECTWKEVSMSEMITPGQVKKVYYKACLAIHPDKARQEGKESEELAKAIFVELNEAWSAFEESKYK